MLIKYMDEILTQNLFDVEIKDTVTLHLLAVDSIDTDKKKVKFKIEDTLDDVPKSILYYNDESDGSNTFISSWQKYYCKKLSLFQLKEHPKDKPFLKGDKIFKNGFPTQGGFLKSLVYLRYSNPLIDWLKENKQEQAAEEIKIQQDKFDLILDEKKKLAGNWTILPKIDIHNWILPIVTKLNTNKYLVIGLNDKDLTEDEKEILEDLNIDFEVSLKLQKDLITLGKQKSENGEKSTTTKCILTDELQMGGGIGRNTFGASYKPKNFPEVPNCEFIKLLGPLISHSRDELLDVWQNKPSYKVKVSPNPDNSEIIFMPSQETKFNRIIEFIKQENEKKDNFFKQQKENKSKIKNNEDKEDTIISHFNTLPVTHKANLILVNIEGNSNKQKYILQRMFPFVVLRYFAALNTEFLSTNLQNELVDYMTRVITGYKKGGKGRQASPSVYNYWTTVLTDALDGKYISANELFYSFQRYCRGHSGQDLIDKKQAVKYFDVIKKLLRLQYIIYVYTEGKKDNEVLEQAKIALDKSDVDILEYFETPEFVNEVSKIEQLNNIKKGVFAMNSTQSIPNPAEIVGDVYHLLWSNQKDKLDTFVKLAYYGTPEQEFKLFVKGALVGMFLSELSWILKNEGRSFSVTQGRHPTTLRGEEILNVLNQGIGMLINLDKEYRFNCSILPFIKSCEKESLKDTFNSGLIMGLVFYVKKDENNSEEQENN